MLQLECDCTPHCPHSSPQLSMVALCERVAISKIGNSEAAIVQPDLAVAEIGNGCFPARNMQAKGMPLITLTPDEFSTRQRSVSECSLTERKHTPVVTVALPAHILLNACLQQAHTQFQSQFDTCQGFPVSPITDIQSIYRGYRIYLNYIVLLLYRYIFRYIRTTISSILRYFPRILQLQRAKRQRSSRIALF